MLNDTQLLEYLCQDAEMGRDSLSHIASLTKNNELQGLLTKQVANYQKSYQAADRLLHEKGKQAKGINPVTKVSGYVMSSMQTLVDDSPSKVAEIVIQGNTMGITSMTKYLNQYDGSDTQVAKLAKQQLKLGQNNIDQLKKFL